MIESQDLGEGSRIGPFAMVQAGAVLGCRVELGSGSAVMRGAVLGEGVRVGPNSTVCEGVKVGRGAVVSPGSVVTMNVPEETVVAGNPAQISGYVGITATPLTPIHAPPSEAGVTQTLVRGVTLHRMPVVQDLRGPLTFGEAGRHVPFEVKRYFMVFDVASQQIRGEHAHRTLHQFMICVRGSCSIVADDGTAREEFALDHPSIGLHLPPLVWGVQYKYSPGAVLLVLASAEYDPADYIRDYPEFLSIVRGAAA